MIKSIKMYSPFEEIMMSIEEIAYQVGLIADHIDGSSKIMKIQTDLHIQTVELHKIYNKLRVLTGLHPWN